MPRCLEEKVMSLHAARRFGVLGLSLAVAVAMNLIFLSLPVVAGPRIDVVEPERVPLESGIASIYPLDPKMPASNIVVGNPEIVTVSLIDPQSVLLTPKKMGRTNLLFLDSNKKVFKALLLEVDLSSVRAHDVQIYRALTRTDIECSWRDCAPSAVTP